MLMQNKRCFGGLIGIGLVMLLLGYGLFSPPARAQVLSVRILNQSSQSLSSVTFIHGNANTMEEVTIYRIGVDQQRTIGLNHEPSQGFNMVLTFADGLKKELCVGKLSTSWALTQVIRDDDIYELDELYTP